MKFNNDFETRLLYDQACKTEDGLSVYTSMYAALWTYPGAMSKTTARIKLSCVYSTEGGELNIMAATIEKWRNEGWSLVDDYHDTRQQHFDIIEVRQRLLNQAKSFLMGIPLEKIDEDYTPDDPNLDSATADTKPVLSVIDFKKSKDALKGSKNDSKNNKSSKEDDDDFDFI